ncbi:glycosyltransferase [Actinobacillus porcinus]|uniref:glycosyltransferase n=1 Tax=Actinobacillus porcinus TaxID=51048 RepID=UPI002352146B|nr:glycosyltransferase [Actinobacillus porcinus]
MIRKLKGILNSYRSIKKCISFLDSGLYIQAKQSYLLFLSYGGRRNRVIESRIINLKSSYSNTLNVAVSGWDLSHNAAGRAITLAELYQYSGFKSVTVIGSLLQNKKKIKLLWEPIREYHIPLSFFEVDLNNIDLLLHKSINFVINHPFDIVHLSKPRITNILLGVLYKYIWNSTVFIDIDDEELAFIGNSSSRKFSSKEIKAPIWTELSLQYYDIFNGVTVSNPALQQKYGGTIIPHVRNERIFKPSLSLKKQNRKLYGIKDDDIVVLFFGTPKRHKGLLETARSIADVKHKNIIFMIVGNFDDQQFKKELTDIEGVNYLFLPNQPYEKIRDIVSVGDICILMQDKNNEIAKYQLPAKLIDSLAMGLIVFLQETDATSGFIDKRYVRFVDRDCLSETLKEYISNNLYLEINHDIHEYFLHSFSMSAYHNILIEFINMKTTKTIHHDEFKFLSKIVKMNNIEEFLSKYAYDY